MRAFVLLAVTTLLLASLAHAEDAQERSALFEAAMRQEWAGIDEQIRLREVDKEALQVTTTWWEGAQASAPTSGEAGRVVFEYGATMPRVLCTPERLCDIELQRGETFDSDPMVGDQARWVLEPALSGGSLHVVVKPRFPNISTNLAIYTNRRVYHIELQSTKGQFMPFVSFVYPEDRKAKWLRLAGAVEGGSGLRQAGPRSKEYEVVATPGNLNFDYKIKREGRWRMRRKIDWEPKRVFDDGEKTIIEMPRSVLAREMPILLVRDGDGKDKIVNFRTKGEHIVVDRLFRHAVLVKGVGRRAERIGLYREEQ